MVRIKLKKNSRGMQADLKNIIIAIIVIVILFQIIPPAATYIGKTFFPEAMCRFSIAGAAASQSLIDVDCKQKDILIKASNVKKKGDTQSEDLIKKKIADNLVTCWNYVDAGRLTGNPVLKQSGVFSNKATCILCSKIDFDKEIKEKFPKIFGFRSFLDNNDMPNTNVRYSKYLVSKVPKNTFTIGNSEFSTIFSELKDEKFVPYDELSTRLEYISGIMIIPGSWLNNVDSKASSLLGIKANTVITYPFFVASNDMTSTGCEVIIN